MNEILSGILIVLVLDLLIKGIMIAGVFAVVVLICRKFSKLLKHIERFFK